MKIYTEDEVKLLMRKAHIDGYRLGQIHESKSPLIWLPLPHLSINKHLYNREQTYIDKFGQEHKI